MSRVVVGQGQSLWSIAKQQLPAGASDAQIKQASNQIAAANGLAPEAKLQLHQQLVIPDSFAGVTTDKASADALRRLATAPKPGSSALATRLGATARPLVDFKAVFSPTTTVPAGAVALPPIAGKPVQGEVRTFQGVKSFIDAAAFNTVDARLGKLTEAEFKAVHGELGGRSAVKFDPARDYAVSDFLPPALQALLNRDLEIPAMVTLKGTKQLLADFSQDPADLQVNLTMNCHATAWEAMRAYQGAKDSVAVFYGEMITMDGRCEDRAQFDKLADITPANLAELLKLDLKPGDLVQFHEVSQWARMTMLMHSAVYVGGGLFFDKPNTEGPEKDDPTSWAKQDETPFRLATLADMAKPLDSATEGKYRIEVLRPKVQLEEPAQAFGSGMAKEIEAIAQKKGRTLGTELVIELEQGSGGGIRGEGVSALVRVGLGQNPDGTSTLA